MAEIAGKLAGFACINKVELIEYKELNWSLSEEAIILHRMAVNPDYRSRGIGTELMEFAEEFSIESNIRYLKTDTYSINTKMNTLFKKFNYKIMGEIHFLGREKPFYCYEKVLKLEN